MTSSADTTDVHETTDALTANGPGDGVALDHTPLHLAPAQRVVPIDGFEFDGPSFERYIAEHTSDAEPGRLVFVEHSDAAWGMWECHPAGDEIVVVLSGVARFAQELDGAVVWTRVTAGQAVVNPAGVWHTANVEVPFSAMYLTPCPGTVHRPR